jgi:hypothetical protein
MSAPTIPELLGHKVRPQRRLATLGIVRDVFFPTEKAGTPQVEKTNAFPPACRGNESARSSSG